MFIKAPLRTVADCLVRWGNEEVVGRHTTAEPRRVTLERAWEHVNERQFSPNRAFLIPIGEWTAFFDNHSYEFLAQAELFVLCLKLRVATSFFSYDHDESSEQSGSSHFCYDRYEEGEFPVKEREVMVLKESGWQFVASGDPLPFEDTEAYSRRRKRDRLNADILRAYGEALGIPFWDAHAYGRDVVLLRWGETAPEDSDSTLRKIIKIFGKPKWTMDCDGLQRPPE